MTRIDKAARLTLAWTMVALGSMTGIQAPRALAADRPFDPQPFSKAVYGDFLYVGNGSLRCPEKGEDGTSEGHAEKCLKAAERKGAGTGDPGSNDGYFMQQSDVDDTRDTFNSSTSELTIPAGAKVTFAQLNWAGHTGRRPNSDSLRCMSTAPKAKHPPEPAKPLEDDGPRKQNPELRIGDTRIQVEAAGGGWRGQYTEDDLDNSTGGQLYTNYQRLAEDDPDPQIQDEIKKLQQLPTGTPLKVTVGNIWTVSGVGCAAGWSLVLIYEFDQPQAPRRQVLVYNAHVKPDNGDKPTTLTIAGFHNDGANARIGLTAYEGDWGPGGQDRFAVDGTLQAEPETGKTDDFFLSDATQNDSLGHGMQPGYKNSFSVDAKVIRTDAINNDDQKAELTFFSERPGYLVQNVTLSVPLAELTLVKEASVKPVRIGDPATFSVRLTNPTQTTAHNVKVEDPVAPGCGWDVTSFPPGDSILLICHPVVPAGTGPSLANTATVTWDGFGGRQLRTASAAATVIHPALTVTKTAAPSTVQPGATVSYKIVVQNSGDSAITGIKLTDDTVAGCSGTVGDLPSNQGKTIECSAPAGDKTFTSTATAVGNAADGKPVSGSGQATVTVVRPALTVAQTPEPATIVRAGQPVKLTIRVTNSGDQNLTDVKVTNSEQRLDCGDSDLSIGALPAGASAKDIVCTVATGNADKAVTNTATATGTAPIPTASAPPAEPVAAAAVTGSDTDTVTVIHPALTVRKSATPSTVPPGATVRYEIVVQNTGDSAITGINLTDDLVAACSAPVGDLAGTESKTVECSQAAGDKPFVNTATATGTAGDGKPVSATATASVNVISPALTVVQTSDPAGSVRPGDPVTLTTRVTNSGDTALTDVTLTNSEQRLDCGDSDLSIGPLAAGASAKDIVCKVTAGAGDKTITNTATATGRVPARTSVTPLSPLQVLLLGLPGVADRGITASDSTTVTVIHPALKVTKTATPGTVEEGGTVAYKIVVQNTGDSTITGVKLTDSLAARCGSTIGTLLKTRSKTIVCSAPAPGKTFTNTAAVTGTGADGKPVTATGQATVTVVSGHPALTIAKTADHKTVRAGTPVTFTVTVTNTGSVPLTVEVTDKTAPQCSMHISSLAVRAVQSQACTVTPTAIGDITNTATFTARPMSSNGSSTEPITGTSETVTVQVSPAPPDRNRPPTGDDKLGDTGGPTVALAAAGLGLLLLGLGLVVAVRRHKTRR